MNDLMNFFESREAEKVRAFSPVILFLMLFVIPSIVKLKSDWIILITAPIIFIFIISYIVIAAKQYKVYSNRLKDNAD